MNEVIQLYLFVCFIFFICIIIYYWPKYKQKYLKELKEKKIIESQKKKIKNCKRKITNEIKDLNISFEPTPKDITRFITGIFGIIITLYIGLTVFGAIKEELAKPEYNQVNDTSVQNYIMIKQILPVTKILLIIGSIIVSIILILPMFREGHI